MKLNAKQLRVTKPTEEQLASLVHKPIYIVLDNVLDTYNIGSLFRLADAVGAAELILCGGTETPPSSRIHKAAVGTEEWVKWRYFPSAKEALLDLRSQIADLRVIAVEQDKRAITLFDLKSKIQDLRSVAIVVGHETEGISKEALDMADVIVEIPMYGINKSLNVHVSTAVVLYKLIGMG